MALSQNPASRALPRQRLPANLLEDRVVRLEEGREEVGRRVRAPRGTGEGPVLHEEFEVVPDRPVVEAQGLGELVGVVGPLAERVDDPRAVRASPRPAEEVPEELPEDLAQANPPPACGREGYKGTWQKEAGPPSEAEERGREGTHR